MNLNDDTKVWLEREKPKETQEIEKKKEEQKERERRLEEQRKLDQGTTTKTH
jgi:hypothetical protein